MTQGMNAVWWIAMTLIAFEIGCRLADDRDDDNIRPA